MLRTFVCLGMAAALWLSTLHVWFERPPAVEELAERHLRVWERRTGGREVAALRRSNPEWDLMARMFTVLGLVNWMLEDPYRGSEALLAIDRIVDDTLALEREHGMHHFLLPYARERAFRDPEGRSLFVDGEIALMLAARQVAVSARSTNAGDMPDGLRDRTQFLLDTPDVDIDLVPDRRDLDPEPVRSFMPSYDPAPWIDRVVAQIERAPSLLAESYPDEGWIFCNAVALAAVRLYDAERGAPEAHGELLRRWVANARRVFVDHARERSQPTGLLVSSAGFAGKVKQGPEGSTLWLAADMLLLVDEGFAREQYAQARRQLIGSFAGFAWGREWPDGWPGYQDVDSGPTVPLVGANAASSGLALVAARAFGDEALAKQLFTSLDFAAFPVGKGRYAAGNLLADAVVFYARAHGPLWQRVREAGPAAAIGGAS